MRRGATRADCSRGLVDGRVNPLANPFPIDVARGATRGTVVAAAERIAGGERLSEVAAALTLQPHHMYGGAAVVGFEGRVREAITALAVAMTRGEVWLVCACRCPCRQRESGWCHCEVIAKIAFARACSWSLEVEVPWQSPLVAAWMTGLPVAVLMWAGRARPRSLGDSVRRRRFAAAEFDIKQDRVWGDLTKETNTAPILRGADVGWIDAGMMACPCQSTTVMKFHEPKPGKRAAPYLRRRSWLPGCPEPPPEWAAYLSKHDGFFRLGFDVASRLLARKRRVVLEGPVDCGDPVGRPRFFQERYAEHVPLTKLPWAEECKRRFGTAETDILQCMFGCKHAKGTTLISDARSAEEMAPAASHECVHESHAPAAGEDENGNSISELAGEYEPMLCEFLGAVLTGEGAEAVRVVAEEAARVELRAMGADGVANVASAAWIRAAAGPDSPSEEGAATTQTAAHQASEDGAPSPVYSSSPTAGAADSDETGVSEVNEPGSAAAQCPPACGSCALWPQHE